MLSDTFRLIFINYLWKDTFHPLLYEYFSEMLVGDIMLSESVYGGKPTEICYKNNIIRLFMLMCCWHTIFQFILLDFQVICPFMLTQIRTSNGCY